MVDTLNIQHKAADLKSKFYNPTYSEVLEHLKPMTHTQMWNTLTQT